MKSHLFFTKRVAKPVDVKRSFTRTRGDRSHLWLISGPSTSKQLLHWYFSLPPPPPPPNDISSKWNGGGWISQSPQSIRRIRYGAGSVSSRVFETISNVEIPETPLSTSLAVPVPFRYKNSKIRAVKSRVANQSGSGWNELIFSVWRISTNWFSPSVLPNKYDDWSQDE